MAKILMVEDDPRIASFVKRGLEAEGHTVDLATDGETALEMARGLSYPLVVLDRMLPGMDGLEVCRTLRLERRDCCVLMLTAKDGVRDKIDGLKDGADDYLTKPFAFDELVARIDALLRRASKPAAELVLRVADLVLDPGVKQVRRGSREIALTAREFTLLAYLMAHAGTVVSRARLLSNVWEISFDPGTKVVDVYIRYLRQKIDADGETPLIKTVRGFGYMIAGEPDGSGDRSAPQDTGPP
ncbi:response regulator transcription factor [Craurococcus roseus]|uniref:Response regulator transcription factor n=1 Tax=Craurococcus roseus TaxID=77585 RepID=A0ABN1FZ88_9PROT